MQSKLKKIILLIFFLIISYCIILSYQEKDNIYPIEIESVRYINEILGSNNGEMYYISSKDCFPCYQFEKKLENIKLDKKVKIKYVDLQFFERHHENITRDTILKLEIKEIPVFIRITNTIEKFYPLENERNGLIDFIKKD